MSNEDPPMTETPKPNEGDASAPRRASDPWQAWILPGVLALAFLGFAALRPAGACGAGNCAMPPAAAGNTAPSNPSLSPTARLAVLYLHGTVRCETCLEIERIAERTVRESFSQELAAGTVSWQAIDYELPENDRYDREFSPPCPSLVLAEVLADGRFARHKILGETWNLIHDEPQAVAAYVRREIEDFRPANPAVPPRSPETPPTP